MRKKAISILFPVGLFFLILILPPSVFHMPGLTALEQRVIAIFALAACCWVLEPIPIFATSVLVVVLELLLLSDKGLTCFAGAENSAAFGSRLAYQDIMATFASPVVMLFLGGFFWPWPPQNTGWILTWPEYC